MKNAFDGLLDTTEERLSELENISIGTSKTEKQKEQRLKKRKNPAVQSIQGLWDKYKRC